MATDIYFVTDLQSAQQLTDLLNCPESIVTFNESNADMAAKAKKRSSIKNLFKKKKKKSWPESAKALRKVVLYSKQQKVHYEVSVVGQGQGHWEIGNPIEEAYVRSLKTLRVVPWLRSLYAPSKKDLKKQKKKEKKLKEKEKHKSKSLFHVPKPPKPLWGIKKKKSKNKGKANEGGAQSEEQPVATPARSLQKIGRAHV